jgi:hypothetical protein
MNPDSPSSIRSESTIPSNPASPISIDDEFSGIYDPDRMAQYQDPEYEVMPYFNRDDPRIVDDADSVRNSAALIASLTMERNKFQSFVQQCLTKCVNDIAEQGIILSKFKRQRDEQLMEIVIKASEGGFFGKVVFIDVLTDILAKLEHVYNRDYSITFILEHYYTSVFEEASRYLLRIIGNPEYTFRQLCQQTCVLIVVRLLVDSFGDKGEFTYFGKARSNSIKTVNKDVKYLLRI